MESREHMQATEREYSGNMHFFIGKTLHLESELCKLQSRPLSPPRRMVHLWAEVGCHTHVTTLVRT